MIESLLDKEKRDTAYEFWRTDKVLLERNSYIAGIFQDFLDNSTEENFFKVLIANYLLESIYFYNGFAFFFSLATRHLMGGTADIIKYIQKDELTHVVLFQNIIREYVTQNKLTNYQSTIYKLTQEAVEQEIKWTDHIIGNRILGMNEESTEIHTKYLANTRLKALNLGLEILYPGDRYSFNPYSHLEKLGDTQGRGEVKANFFEQTVTEYNMATTVKGWDF